MCLYIHGYTQYPTEEFFDDGDITNNNGKINNERCFLFLWFCGWWILYTYCSALYYTHLQHNVAINHRSSTNKGFCMVLPLPTL